MANEFAAHPDTYGNPMHGKKNLTERDMTEPNVLIGMFERSTRTNWRRFYYVGIAITTAASAVIVHFYTTAVRSPDLQEALMHEARWLGSFLGL